MLTCYRIAHPNGSRWDYTLILDEYGDFVARTNDGGVMRTNRKKLIIGGVTYNVQHSTREIDHNTAETLRLEHFGAKR